jgi:hypothetical protein
MAFALGVSCLFMLGRYTPLYSLGFRFIPGIDLFRRPTDSSFIFTIAFAFVAGHCLADYTSDGLPRLRPLSALLAMAAAVAVIGSAIAFSGRTGHALDAVRETLIPLAVMSAAGVSLFAMRREASRAPAVAAITLAAVIELLWWNTAVRLNAEPWNLYAVLQAPSGPDAAAIALLDKAIAADHQRGDYPRVEVLGLGGPWQNLAMVRGWEAINGYNPLRIGVYDRLVSPGEQNWSVSLRQFPPSFDNYDSPLARALGLTYLILGCPLQDVPGLPAQPPSELLLSGPPVWIYRIPGALPRVSLVGELGTNPTRWDRGSSGAAEHDEPLGDAQSSSPGSTMSRPGAGVATIESSAPGQLDVVTTSTRAEFLLVHDLFYPGWVVDVDGIRRSIVRAGGLFRAVVVPAGTHHVRFRFAPFSLENLNNALHVVQTQSDLISQQ